MTTNEIKQLILSCTRFGVNGNQKDINKALNAVNELQQDIIDIKATLMLNCRKITATSTCKLLDNLIKDKI